MKDFDYQGFFKNGLKHGKGKLINKKYNWTYEGQFSDDCMHGIGKYIFADGTIFTGEFVKDVRTDNGQLLLVNGDII